MVKKAFLSLVLASACLFSSCSKEEKKPKELQEPARPTKVLDYLRLSSQFLINQQQPHGFFYYEYDFITGNYTPWDNIIHQTKAGYVLASYYSFLIRNSMDPARAAIVKDSVINALKGYVEASLERSETPGMIISFYYNKGGSFKSLANTDLVRQDFRKNRLDAEIVATAFALMTEIIYWQSTGDAHFSESREKWRDTLVYQMRPALEKPVYDKTYYPEVWLALALYDSIISDDKEVQETLAKLDKAFTQSPRQMTDIQDYVWDMMAANLRFQRTENPALVTFASQQTSLLLEKIYTQHDATENSCALALGLVEASLLLNKRQAYERVEQTALGRSQLEYYSSLKFMILPDQTWIALGPGRSLHSQDFKKFTGAYIYGRHNPKTSIDLSEMCLLTGMRFSKTDLMELKDQLEVGH